MPPFEVLLPLGAIGLYLFDSALLLYSNELLFLRRARGWIAGGHSSLLLAGRRVYLPNPFTPGTPQFRVRWSEADTRQERESGADLEEFFAALRPLQYLVGVLLAILVALPVELAVFGTGVELLVLMACFYAVILASLVHIFLRRRALSLSRKAFLSVAFDALACAPFAINLVRKLAQRRSLAGNPIEFARETFDPGSFARLIHAVARRVSEEQRREYGQTPRWAVLEAFSRRLDALSGRRLDDP